MALETPAERLWPVTGGIDFLIGVYDWDVVRVNAVGPLLDTRAVMCSKYLPCFLALVGGDLGTPNAAPDDNHLGVLRVVGDGSVVCLRSRGCTSLVLHGVAFTCGGDSEDRYQSASAVVEAGGTSVEIRDSVFQGCSSAGDGGSVRAYDEASVAIDGTLFSGSYSSGWGGAISIVGGLLSVHATAFLNCSSAAGGGAVAAAAFVCYGHSKESTVLVLESCTFEGCATAGSGGAIQIIGNATSLDLSASDFATCTSSGSGGAVSVSSGAFAKVEDCAFFGNSAHDQGGGGGALHSEDATLLLHKVICARNTAPRGGGGALFWSGDKAPVLTSWCGAGYYAESDIHCVPPDCPSACLPCEPGTFSIVQGSLNSSTCILCDPGTFSSSTGVSACNGCPAGTFSTAAGAIVVLTCIDCGAGSFSGQSSTGCSVCLPGSYSNGRAAACFGCSAGTYSTTIGAGTSALCTACLQGLYSLEAASTCSRCSAGTFSSASGATSCHACAEGTVALQGQAECILAETFLAGDMLEMSGDLAIYPIVLPFPFPFFCTEFSLIFATSRGILQLGDLTRLGYSEHVLCETPPAPCQGDNIIAAFWDSLAGYERSSFLEWVGYDEVTLQWTNWDIVVLDQVGRGEPTGSTVTFQVTQIFIGLFSSSMGVST